MFFLMLVFTLFYFIVNFFFVEKDKHLISSGRGKNSQHLDNYCNYNYSVVFFFYLLEDFLNCKNWWFGEKIYHLDFPHQWKSLNNLPNNDTDAIATSYTINSYYSYKFIWRVNNEWTMRLNFSNDDNNYYDKNIYLFKYKSSEFLLNKPENLV